ncbi:MAG TPA: 23S rRNA (uracil(1939)-C(5))-methyltransferase RlmD, partial [Allocoleopsis sp.]
MSQKLATEISIDENGDHQWQQGQLVEVEITDLTDNGDGVGRFAGRVVFVPDTAIGDRVIVRLLRVKPTYAHGKFTEILVNSSDRIRPPCIVADKCGGCQWLHINYASQLEVKRNQIIQVLQRIGNIPNPPVADVLPSSNPLGYRNKVSYPMQRSATGQVKVGYYKKGSHELINLNQCPVQDQRLNPLLAEVKQDIQAEGWSIYDEKLNRGKLRYLSLRIGSNTGEILLTLVSTSDKLTDLDIMAQMWLERYPNLVGVCLNIQPDQSNTILGDTTVCIAGKSYLEEEFLGLKFHLLPDTFFQVNTEGASHLFDVILTELNLQGDEVLVDAYCGV